MNVLVISNSFGVDANTYLHQIARAGGEKINVVTLYIGACSLEKHYRCILGDKRSYEMYFNGYNTEFCVSAQEALLSRRWDVVTLQQASVYSADPESYEPYGSELAAFVRKYAPRAKLLIHQTWAYEQGSERLLTRTPYKNASDMFRDIEKAYMKFAANVHADGIIPSGKLMQDLLESGIPTVHRDTLHATKGLGRYALGLLWYRILTGRSVADNPFCDFHAPVTAEEMQIAKACVDAFKPVFPNGI